MHEFILYSQISVARYHQTCQILAGLTAAQPVDFSQQHLIYQQTKSTGPTISKKAQTAQNARATQLNYHKLVRDCDNGKDAHQWRLRKEEQPEAGFKDVISRTAAETVVTETALERFKLGSEWYR